MTTRTQTTKPENALVFGTLFNGKECCKGITYTFTAGILAGKTFTGGRPCQAQQDGKTISVVRFAEKFKTQTVNATYSDKPELAELVAEYNEYQEGQTALRLAEQSAQAEQRKALTAPLIAAMRAEAEAIIAALPADAVRVTIKNVLWADGDEILEMEAEGVRLTYRDVQIAGIATATVPGALAPFESIRIITITQTRLDEIKNAVFAKATEAQAKTEAAQAGRTAKFAEAARTGQPIFLLSYMADCDGSAEDCSFDNIETYAQPDGTTKEMRQHCH